ncbi:Alanine aminotransferase 1 [Larimichthys crocea]|uniref:Uncharacterized protein n=1 Tax=Larimichthys crocea TaxID=215358 RepID=A0ACD3QRR8_LARCR|nr:Alanine aminotransferase 1 [Larimichthys crocea]
MSEPRPVQLCVMLQCFKRLQQQPACRRTLSALGSLYGARKPYNTVIDVTWGDIHRAGVKPLSFVRQVLAACLDPTLVNSDKLPADARQRAQRLLGGCVGGSVGSYTATAGISEIVHRISEFITRRDGGVPSHPENIYISPGSQWALTNILKILVNSKSSPQTAVLTPLPCHSTTSLSITSLGAVAIPYNLSEEQGWALQMEELHRALEFAKGVYNPVALYVINPGNPSGHVQSRKSMQDVIRFVSEKRLFLLADEVYQDFVYGEHEFVSYKRVLAEMGPPFADTVELASFHSVSKGFTGEGGLRCGYVELVNVDPAVMKYIYKMFSMDTCAPVLGQLALDLMLNPPQPGDPSYPLYNVETRNIKTAVANNVKRASEVVNGLPGFCCQPVQGGAFAFPRLYLPPKAIQKAKEMGMQPDTFYCLRLLEETGVFASPGCEYGLKEGTYHVRFCILTPEDTMEELLGRLTSFHTQFMKDFS